MNILECFPISKNIDHLEIKVIIGKEKIEPIISAGNYLNFS